MAKKQKSTEEEPQVCEKCGSVKLQDDVGNWYCPNCDAEIDWGLEDDV